MSKRNKGLIIALVILSIVVIIISSILAYYVFKLRNNNEEQAINSNALEENIQVSENEIENIQKELNKMFSGNLPKFDCETISVKEFVTNILIPVWDSPIYDYYFGEENNNGKIERYSVETNPDPLSVFSVQDSYIKLSKENIDWLMINVFNIPDEKVNSASIDDYLYVIGEYNEYINKDEWVKDGKIRYYYDGYFYQKIDGYGAESGFELKNLHSADGKNYSADFYCYDFGELFAKGTMIIEPKMLNGEKHWTIHSIEYKDLEASDVNEKAENTTTSVSTIPYDPHNSIIIDTYNNHLLVLKNDGTVLAFGENEWGELDVADWSKIVAISSGCWHTVGLRSDGTVVAVGMNRSGKCDVANWTDVIAIDANITCTVGLKKDGTVVVSGKEEYYDYDVSDWNGIIKVLANDSNSGGYVVGLKDNGKVVATGNKDIPNSKTQWDVSNWSNIVDIFKYGDQIVGLKSDGSMLYLFKNDFDGIDNIKEIAIGSVDFGLKTDGTVVNNVQSPISSYYNKYGQCNVDGWRDIAHIAAAGDHTVGLKKDGTVIAVGDNDDGQCNVYDWENIVAVYAYNSATIGLKSDGTIVIVGRYYRNIIDNLSGLKNVKTK